MPATAPNFNIHQLMMLRSLLRNGWPCELLEYLPRRCGASQADWDVLVEAGLVEQAAGRWQLTKEGKRAYRRGSVGKYF